MEGNAAEVECIGATHSREGRTPTRPEDPNAFTSPTTLHNPREERGWEERVPERTTNRHSGTESRATAGRETKE